MGIGSTTALTTKGKLGVYATGDQTEEGTAAATIGSWDASGMRLYFGVNNTNSYTYIGSVQSGTAYRNLVLQPNGSNVGIGTSSPSALLSIKNSGMSSTLLLGSNTSNSNYGSISFNGSNADGGRIGWTAGGSGNNNLYYDVPSSGEHIWRYGSGSTEAMRINTSGNFMVGTSTTGGIITASGAQGGGAVIRSINTTSSGGVAGVVSVLQSNGNSTSSSHFLGSTTGINNWYLYGNGTTSYSSDIRLKKNVQTARGYLNDIARLRVVKYQWIGDNPDCQQVELGLIAQEVEEVFPNLIQEHEIEGVGMRKNIKQSVLPFMLLKSIQELKAINDQQAETINALTARIVALENK
jgi:hypothetical protein